MTTHGIDPNIYAYGKPCFTVQCIGGATASLEQINKFVGEIRDALGVKIDWYWPALNSPKGLVMTTGNVEAVFAYVSANQPTNLLIEKCRVSGRPTFRPIDEASLKYSICVDGKATPLILQGSDTTWYRYYYFISWQDKEYRIVGVEPSPTKVAAALAIDRIVASDIYILNEDRFAGGALLDSAYVGSSRPVMCGVPTWGSAVDAGLARQIYVGRGTDREFVVS